MKKAILFAVFCALMMCFSKQLLANECPSKTVNFSPFFSSKEILDTTVKTKIYVNVVQSLRADGWVIQYVDKGSVFSTIHAIRDTNLVAENNNEIRVVNEDGSYYIIREVNNLGRKLYLVSTYSIEGKLIEVESMFAENLPY
jgi:hypothetical protein